MTPQRPTTHKHTDKAHAHNHTRAHSHTQDQKCPSSGVFSVFVSAAHVKITALVAFCRDCIARGTF